MKGAEWVIGYVESVRKAKEADELDSYDCPTLDELQTCIDQHSIHPNIDLTHAMYADPNYVKEE